MSKATVVRFPAMALFMAAAVCGGACEDEESFTRDAALPDGYFGSSSPDAAVDAPSTRVEVDATVATPDAAVPDAAPPGRNFYLSPTGLDTNPGTREMPRKTISAAAAMAGAGDTIWLLDGTWDDTVDPNLFRDCMQPTAVFLDRGAVLRAVNPKQAGINGKGNPLCVRTVTIADIRFSGNSVKSIDGQATLENVTLEGPAGCGGSAAIDVSGTAKITLRNTATASVLGDNKVCAVGLARDSAELAVIGGTYFMVANGGASGSGLFASSNSAKLSFDGVTVDGSGGGLVAINMRAVPDTGLSIKDCTFVALQNIAIVGPGQDIELRLTNTTIRGAKDSGVRWSNGHVIAIDSLFDGNGVPILGASGLELRGTRVINSGFFGLTVSASSRPVVIENSEISGSAGHGIDIEGAGCKVKMRNTVIANNGNNGGVVLRCSGAGSEIDLGKVDDLGRNTFAAPRANASSVFNSTAAATVFAVGNTWTPSVQGADASGKYSAVGPGAVLEVATGVGANFQLASGRLRLAENP